MNVLLTGASGFLGKKYLKSISNENFKIYAIVRKKFEFKQKNLELIIADLSNESWIKSVPEIEFDYVIYLAQSNLYRDFPNSSVDLIDVNVKSVIALAKWSISRNVKKFLFASTGNIYGSKNRINYESTIPEPDTFYGISKYSCELLLKPFSTYFDILILRIFGLYGPGQKDALLPSIINKVLNEEKISLAKNIGVKYNPIFVSDCAKIINHLINKKDLSSFEVINIGGDEIIDIKRICDISSNIIGKDYYSVYLDSDPHYLIGGIDKLLNLIPSLNLVSFEDGLKNVLSK